MDWAVASTATVEPTKTATPNAKAAFRIRAGIDHLIALRKKLPALHAAVTTDVRSTHNRGVLVFDRRHPAGHLVQVYNVSDTATWIDTRDLGGLHGTVDDHITGHRFDMGDGFLLAPYEVRWLTAP